MNLASRFRGNDADRPVSSGHGKINPTVALCHSEERSDEESSLALLSRRDSSLPVVAQHDMTEQLRL
jgi:hypothetical protein